MSLLRYEKMKHSGIDWLGDVPQHWRIAPLLAVANEREEPNIGMKENNLLSLSYGRIVPKDISSNDGLLPESFETYQVVRPGDVVWRLTDLQNDKRSLRTAIVNEVGIITSAYLATTPRNISSSFLNYLLRAYDLTKVFYSMGGGLRQSMKFSDAKRLPILVPPDVEQSDIVTFLDRETAKIDALVAEQQRLIELLKEKRQAVISQAVTKGLDPNAPMKDSGVEWLGEVPEHWRVSSVGRVCRYLSYGFTNPMPTADDGPFMLTANDIDHGRIRFESARRTTWEAFEELLTNKSRPQAGDILLTKDGTLGRVAVHDGQSACINQSVAVLRPSAENLPSFLALALGGGVYQERMIYEAGGTTIKHIYISRLAKMPMAIPNQVEQIEIVEALESEIARFDALMTEAETMRSLLQERRAALISAAVTGKIKVSGMAAHTGLLADRGHVRRVVAAEIIERLAQKSNFGRVKLQKLAYLTETHADVGELEGNYMRAAAGPLDRDMIAEMEAQLQRAGHISVDQPGGHGKQVVYKFCGRTGAYREELTTVLGERKAGFLCLIKDLGDLETKSVEAIATLYAVWNDALIDGHAPTDDSVVSGVLEEWHPDKAKKFRAAELHEWLGWMRRHGLVPQGKGPRTSTGRLFL